MEFERRVAHCSQCYLLELPNTTEISNCTLTDLQNHPQLTHFGRHESHEERIISFITQRVRGSVERHQWYIERPKKRCYGDRRSASFWTKDSDDVIWLEDVVLCSATVCVNTRRTWALVVDEVDWHSERCQWIWAAVQLDEAEGDIRKEVITIIHLIQSKLHCLRPDNPVGIQKTALSGVVHLVDSSDQEWPGFRRQHCPASFIWWILVINPMLMSPWRTNENGYRRSSRLGTSISPTTTMTREVQNKMATRLSRSWYGTEWFIEDEVVCTENNLYEQFIVALSPLYQPLWICQGSYPDIFLSCESFGSRSGSRVVTTQLWRQSLWRGLKSRTRHSRTWHRQPSFWVSEMWSNQ